MKVLKVLIMAIFSVSTIANAQNPDFLKMVEYAVKAPSGHNTQPWKFKISDNSIEIHPNFNCALPAVDGNNRELYISLGCALENLHIAANEFGYQANSSIENTDSVYVIHVALKKTTDDLSNSLFEQIEKRQTNRNVYENRMITGDTIQMLSSLQVQPDIKFYFYENGIQDYVKLTDYVMSGNKKQMSNKHFKKELLSWMRFNKKEVDEKNNGLSYAAIGAPSMPSWISRPIVKSFLNPKKQNKSDLKKIQSSSHIVLFTLIENTPIGWIETGRSLERFLLKCTELGIAIAYINQPCEEKLLAKQIQTDILHNNETSMLLLRIGYAAPIPYSPRKPIDKVIMK